MDDSATRPPPLVVVGASAGGVEALRDFVLCLPSDLAACVLVVLHLPPTSPSALPAILRRQAELSVAQARDGDELSPATVLVAPPNHHLVVLDGRIALTHGPQENGHRPSVDVLFRSAARAAGERVLAVVLSGTLDDGAAGAAVVAARGGTVWVQDPSEAIYDGMPRAVAAAVPGAKALSVTEMGAAIAEWCDRVPGPRHGSSPPPIVEQEVAMASLDPGAMHDAERPGTPAGLGCPDCGGALYQLEEGPVRRFRCRVGHAWSAESLIVRQTVETEGALWMALRSLEEKGALNRDLARHAQEHGQHVTARRFSESAEEAVRAAELVRKLIQDIDELAQEPNSV